ncbi:MAG: type II CAAX endopeptidase family protein [Verrucomicrobiota bacterium]
MAVELDLFAILVSLILLAFVCASGFLWYLHFRYAEARILPEDQVPTWPIGWVNFGIFMCTLFVAVAFVPLLGSFFIRDAIEAADGELTPFIAIYGVLLSQLPMLGVFYGLRRLYPGQYAGQLSANTLSLGEAIWKTIPLFIKLLPLVWIAGMFWSSLVAVLERSGIIGEQQPQELVELFKSGGSFAEILILFVLAVFLAPLVEEIIFRGCIYRFLKSKAARLPAQIFSATLFGLMHQNLLALFPLIIVGIILARIYEKSGSIFVPICFHACFNAFSLIMLFLLSQSKIGIE